MQIDFKRQLKTLDGKPIMINLGKDDKGKDIDVKCTIGLLAVELLTSDRRQESATVFIARNNLINRIHSAIQDSGKGIVDITPDEFTMVYGGMEKGIGKEGFLNSPVVLGQALEILNSLKMDK